MLIKSVNMEKPPDHPTVFRGAKSSDHRMIIPALRIMYPPTKRDRPTAAGFHEGLAFQTPQAPPK
jgi:hypothetical protein